MKTRFEVDVDKVRDNKDGGEVFADTYTPGAAELIVRAVNLHDELVCVLENRISDIWFKMSQPNLFVQTGLNSEYAKLRDLLRRARGEK
jgi:hypothetical protein